MIQNALLPILIVIGSSNLNSISREAVHPISEGCTSDRTEVHILDVGTLDIPSSTMNRTISFDLYRLKQAVEHAHAVVLISPEVASTYTPLMQRVLHSCAENDLLKDKVVGCVGLGGGVAGGARALIQLLEEVNRQGAYLIPSSVFVPQGGIILSNGRFSAFAKSTYRCLQALGRDVAFATIRLQKLA